MTGLDWVIVGAVVLLALFGWLRGFLAGALSLAGFAVGAWAGTRLAPLVLDEGRRSPAAPLLGLGGALFAGTILAAGFEGVGARLRARMRSPLLGTADGLLGAVLAAGVGLGVAWLLAAVALTNGGSAVRREVQRSAILARLNRVLPPSGPLLDALARFDTLPHVAGPEAA